MVTQGKKIFIIAREASGDFIGSKLIAARKRIRANLEFYGVGGPHMELIGIRSLVPMS